MGFEVYKKLTYKTLFDLTVYETTIEVGKDKGKVGGYICLLSNEVDMIGPYGPITLSSIPIDYYDTPEEAIEKAKRYINGRIELSCPHLRKKKQNG